MLTRYICGLFLLLCCATGRRFIEDAFVNTKDTPHPPPQAAFETRPVFKAVSLRNLQEQYSACSKEGNCPDSLMYLGGLKTVEGFIIDAVNKDIVLVGRNEADLPPLLIDDLIVMMRCAGKMYVNGNIFTPPGCSIDPDPAVMQQLNELSVKIQPGKGLADHRRRWNEICRKPQTVRVLGIPFNSHAASIFVRADYEMKHIIDGQDDLDVPGFYDLQTFMWNASLQRIRDGVTSNEQELIFNRFWFCPQKYHFKIIDNMTIIDTCRISLLTEEQFLTKNNQQAGKGFGNPMAQQVADRFSAHFETIAGKKTIFRQLQELLRMYCVLEALATRSAADNARLDLSYFMRQCALKKCTVDTTLPGRSRFAVDTIYDGDGYTVTQFVLTGPACGGVMFNVAVADSTFATTDDPTCKALPRSVLAARFDKAVAWWDVRNQVSKDTP